ncbi:hypothetical protein C0995_003035 [Termitomyces sp. Mi166|nr:hypothetical protein C0995_003035 [Termitomyces sp. Mi166\
MARLSTVYDFSSLRLHPDGSRVRQSTSKNQRLRYAAGVVQDSRGNWFAHDAAGSGAVGRYRKVQEKKEEHGEEWNDVDEGEEDDSSKDRGKGKEKEISRQRHNPRPAKRQKFLRDFDFLTPTASTGFSSTDALPSSDLLKSIHYFASSYYHERGQLFNATQDYRQMRKQNRLKKLEQQKKAEADRENSESDEDSEQDETNRPRRGGRKKGVTGKIVHRKDMYKMLDGSALMAIGMLIQEYVSRTLEVRIPNGWEDMMRDADVGEETATYSREDDESIIDEEVNPDAEVTDANSEENVERDCESREDENGDDDDDDDDGENKGPQDNGDEHEEEAEEDDED